MGQCASSRNGNDVSITKAPEAAAVPMLKESELNATPDLVDRGIQAQMHAVRKRRIEIETAAVAKAGATASNADIAEIDVTVKGEPTMLQSTMGYLSGRIFGAEEEAVPSAAGKVERTPEEISKAVNPSATLPTVEKVYAPNVYPSPPVFKAQDLAPEEPPSSGIRLKSIVNSVRWLNGRIFGAEETAGAA